MKANLTNREKCLVCEHTNLEPILSFYSKFLPKLFHSVSICRDCGHIQLFPLLDQVELEDINNRFFGNKYMAKNQQNLANNSKKLQKLDERISNYLKKDINVLDVGAGEAWAMEYFQERNCNYFAIEFVPRLAESIQERGGKVIGRTIFDDYSNHKSHFDIILFRHILEHLRNPNDALTALRKMLRANGIIYLALPNAQNPSANVGFKDINKKGFRTSFIRPVHISYFCEGNVHYLAHSVGLTPLVSEASNEIFCLLQHADNNHATYTYPNYYKQQKEVFLSTAKMTLLTDCIKIVKNLPKTLVKITFDKLHKDTSNPIG